MRYYRPYIWSSSTSATTNYYTSTSNYSNLLSKEIVAAKPERNEIVIGGDDMVITKTKVGNIEVVRSGDSPHEDFTVLEKTPNLLKGFETLYIHQTLAGNQPPENSVISFCVLAEEMARVLGTDTERDMTPKRNLNFELRPPVVSGTGAGWLDTEGEGSRLREGTLNFDVSNGAYGVKYARYYKKRNVLIIGDIFHGKGVDAALAVQLNEWRDKLLRFITGAIRVGGLTIEQVFADSRLSKVPSANPLLLFDDGRAFTLDMKTVRPKKIDIMKAKFLDETTKDEAVGKYRDNIKKKYMEVLRVERDHLKMDRARLEAEMSRQLQNVIVPPLITPADVVRYNLTCYVQSPPYYVVSFPYEIAVEGSYYAGTMLKYDKPVIIKKDLRLELWLNNKAFVNAYLRARDGSVFYWFHGNETLCTGDALLPADRADIGNIDRIMNLKRRVSEVIAWINLDDNVARDRAIRDHPPWNPDLGSLTNMCVLHYYTVAGKDLKKLFIKSVPKKKEKDDKTWEVGWTAENMVPEVIEAIELKDTSKFGTTGKLTPLKEWLVTKTGKVGDIPEAAPA